ncbi:hypothetical protein BX265_6938 [Streptomyces sp. TLI_235]|nr:hypothetical protein [Streptomyces sp. TLI_235]PBC69606.1 hypothetical protein BX265_6938 [Streptomyces sp. TLI_235]
MSLNIPSWAHPVMGILVGHWPTADEDGMRDAATVFDQLAWDADALHGQLSAQSVHVPGWRGESRDAHDQGVGHVLGNSGLAQARESAARLADSIRTARGQVVKAKVQDLEIAAWLVASTAWALASAYFTGGASLQLLAALQAAAEELLAAVSRWLLAAVKAIAGGVLFMVAADASAQGIELLRGDIDTFDLDSLAQSAIGGAVVGAVSLPLGLVVRPAGEALKNTLGALLGKSAGATAERAVGFANMVTTNWVTNAGLGAAQGKANLSLADAVAGAGSAALHVHGAPHGESVPAAGHRAETPAPRPGRGEDHFGSVTWPSTGGEGWGVGTGDGHWLEAVGEGNWWVRPDGWGQAPQDSAFAAAVRAIPPAADGRSRLVVGTPDLPTDAVLHRLAPAWQNVKAAGVTVSEVVLASPVGERGIAAVREFAAREQVKVTAPNGQVVASPDRSLFVPSASGRAGTSTHGQWLHVTPRPEHTHAPAAPSSHPAEAGAQPRPTPHPAPESHATAHTSVRPDSPLVGRPDIPRQAEGASVLPTTTHNSSTHEPTGPGTPQQRAALRYTPPIPSVERSSGLHHLAATTHQTVGVAGEPTAAVPRPAPGPAHSAAAPNAPGHPVHTDTALLQTHPGTTVRVGGAVLDPPRWERALPEGDRGIQELADRLGPVKVSRIPAGLVLSTDRPMESGGPALQLATLPPDRTRLTVVVADAPATGALRTLVESLPPQARESLRLVMAEGGAHHATALMSDVAQVREVVAADGPLRVSDLGHAYVGHRTYHDPQTSHVREAEGQWLHISRPEGTGPGADRFVAQPAGALYPSPPWDQAITSALHHPGRLPGDAARIPAGLAIGGGHTSGQHGPGWDAAQLLPDPHRVTVAVRGAAHDPGLRLQVEDLVRNLAGDPATGSIRLAWDGAGHGEGAAHLKRLADEHHVEIVAPDADITLLPGGEALVTGRDGAEGHWLRFRPGERSEPQGALFPQPSWQQSVDAAVRGDLLLDGQARPVPAGIWLGAPGEPTALPHPGLPGAEQIRALPPHRDRPAVVVTADPTAPTTRRDLDRLLSRLATGPDAPAGVDLLLSHPAADAMMTGTRHEGVFDPVAHELQHLADTHRVNLRIADGAWSPTTDGTLRPTVERGPSATAADAPDWHEFRLADPIPEPRPDAVVELPDPMASAAAHSASPATAVHEPLPVGGEQAGHEAAPAALPPHRNNGEVLSARALADVLDPTGHHRPQPELPADTVPSGLDEQPRPPASGHRRRPPTDPDTALPPAPADTSAHPTPDHLAAPQLRHTEEDPNGSSPSAPRTGRTGDEHLPPPPPPPPPSGNSRIRPIDEAPTPDELAQLHQHPAGPSLIHPPKADPAALAQYKSDNKFNFRLTGELQTAANSLPHNSWGRHDSGVQTPSGRPDVKVSPYSQSFKTHLDPLTLKALHSQAANAITTPLRNELGPEAMAFQGNQVLEAAGNLDFRTQEHFQQQEIRRNVLERLARQDSQQTWHPVGEQRVNDHLDGSTSAMDGVNRLLGGHDGHPGFDGIVLGEAHNQSPSWRFLNENMHALKAAGVDRIYVESLRDDAFQQHLNEFQRPGGTMSPNLEKMLRTYDRNLNSPPGHGLYDTVLRAKEEGVTIHAVDGYPARRPHDLGPQALQERARLLNSYMNHAISEGGRTGKYVLVTGKAHVHEHASSSDHRIPGVAEMLGAPAVRLTDSGRPNPNGAPHDATATTDPGNMRLGYLAPESTGHDPANAAGQHGNGAPPAPPVSHQNEGNSSQSTRSLGGDNNPPAPPAPPIPGMSATAPAIHHEVPPPVNPPMAGGVHEPPTRVPQLAPVAQKPHIGPEELPHFEDIRSALDPQNLTAWPNQKAAAQAGARTIPDALSPAFMPVPHQDNSVPVAEVLPNHGSEELAGPDKDLELSGLGHLRRPVVFMVQLPNRAVETGPMSAVGGGISPLSIPWTDSPAENSAIATAPGGNPSDVPTDAGDFQETRNFDPPEPNSIHPLLRNLLAEDDSAASPLPPVLDGAPDGQIPHVKGSAAVDISTSRDGVGLPPSPDHSEGAYAGKLGLNHAGAVDPTSGHHSGIPGQAAPESVNLVRRQSNSLVWRFDNRSPTEIFASGFKPWAPGKFDLESYLEVNDRSGFVGTTRNLNIRHIPADFRYEIWKPGGIDINKTVPGYDLSHDEEVAFPEAIDPGFIRGAHAIGPDGNPGKWIKNPDFKYPADLNWVLRRSNGPLWRNDDRSPAVVFVEGFNSKNPANIDLADHVLGQGPAGFVSTSKEKNMHWESHYRYKIKIPGGIDVNKTIPGNKFRDEMEIAFPGFVEARFIQGAHELDPYGAPINWIPNPNFHPIKNGSFMVKISRWFK